MFKTHEMKHSSELATHSLPPASAPAATAPFPFFHQELTRLPINTDEDKKELLKLLNNGYDWSRVNKKLFLKMIKDRIAGGTPFSIPTAQEILNTKDYLRLKTAILLLVARRGPHMFTDWSWYFDLLDALPVSECSLSEKVCLTRSFYNTLLNKYDREDISTFIQLSQSLKQKMGASYFIALFQRPIPSQLSQYIKICELLIYLDDRVLDPAIIYQHFPKLDALIQALELLAEQKKIKEKPIEINKLIDRWGFKDDFVQFPLSPTEIEELRTDYFGVHSEIQAVSQLSPSELAKEAQKTTAMLARNPEKMGRLVAIVREAMMHALKTYPYPEQTLAVLALNRKPSNQKGRIAKIRTGEGKSRVLAMLAALDALQDRCVDILTPNQFLAIEAAAQFKSFFQLLGLSCSHLCMEHPQREDFDHLILYATHHDIEFSILRDKTFGADLRYTRVKGVLVKRPLNALRIDEVDVMFLDAQRNAAKIAFPNSKAVSWVYCPLMQFVKDTVKKTQLKANELEKTQQSLLTMAMAEKARAVLAKTAPFKNAEQEFPPSKITQWLNSAFQALYVWRKDHEYMVKKSLDKGVATAAIIIMDKEITGRASSENCRLSHGLHEMLELINHIPIGEESLTCASISHRSLIEGYDFVSGLTGTIGSLVEREEIFSTYKVGTFDVPPRFPNQRVLLEPIYVPDFKTYFEKIIEEVLIMKAQKRPVLLIVETIQETQELIKLLSEHKVVAQLINENQQEDESYLVSRAGYPGVVTVATYAAGRGTDILLHKESLEHGGLHVIFAVFTTNERAEEQGLARAGRQGQAGSARLILCEQQAYIQELLGAMNGEEKAVSLIGDKEFMNKLRLLRQQRVDIESQGRRGLCQRDTIQYQILNEFWSLLHHYQQEMNQFDWEKLAEQCSRIRPSLTIENPTQSALRPTTEGQRPATCSRDAEISGGSREQVAERCPSVVGGQDLYYEHVLEPEGLSSFFTNASKIAQEWISKHSERTKQDWSLWLKDIHAAYQTEMKDKLLKTWAIFFTDIDHGDKMPTFLYQRFLYSQVQIFFNENLHELQNPQGHFLRFLSSLLKNRAELILLTGEKVDKSKFFLQWERKLKESSGSDAEQLRVVIAGVSFHQVNPPPHLMNSTDEKLYAF
jgi:hypothetical protein